MSAPENTGDRIVYPDDVDDAKAAAKEAAETVATTTNSIEEPPSEIGLRNMIQVPSNCPAGQVMGADGVCRDVF